jgi:hypothetical protein
MVAFASLAQLGSGLALALAIFMEPIAFRERRYRSALQQAQLLIPNDGSERSISRRNDVWLKVVQLDESAKRAHALAKPPIRLIKAAAAINFIVLLICTLVPDAELSFAWSWMLLALCVLPVGVGTIWLIVIAAVEIGTLENEYSAAAK